jgi:hypothetical protein
MKDLFRLICVSTLVLSAQASSFSYQGIFTGDDQIQLIDFSLSAGAVVQIASLGYGGGTNATGALIPPGGFDTFFTLFAGDGSQITTNDDAGCAHGNNPFGNGCLDAWIAESLPAGNFTLALTQSGNEPAGALSDGFTQQGQGNFTCPPGFCDVFGEQLNGHWAVDILGANPVSSAPEPATFLLAGLSLLLAARSFPNISNKLKKQTQGEERE